MPPSNAFIDSKGQSAFTIWLTGLPCAGKSTLARTLAQELRCRGKSAEILDADVLRTTLCKDLSFSKADRDENVFRVGWVCALLAKHGVTSIVAVVSPHREARERIRLSVHNFVEVYVKAPIDVCIQRDVKGMYARALKGELQHFTGIDDCYEEPVKSEIVVETDKQSLGKCKSMIVDWLENNAYLASSLTYGLKATGRR